MPKAAALATANVPPETVIRVLCDATIDACRLTSTLPDAIEIVRPAKTSFTMSVSNRLPVETEIVFCATVARCAALWNSTLPPVTVSEPLASRNDSCAVLEK